MKAALLPRYAVAPRTPASRAARACLAILVLGAAAACTKQEGRPPSAPSAVAPFATMPAPVESPASAAPAYMADHVARDAALAQALVGSWAERTTVDGRPADMAMTFKADGGFWTVTTFTGATDVISASGTWQISRGFLTYAFGGKEAGRSGSAEILRIDANEFVYVDAEDKKTKVAVRRAAPGTAAPAAPATAIAAAPPPQEPTLLGEERLFVASEEATGYTFRVGETAQFQLTVEIEERVPLNVILLPGRITSERYTMALAHLMLGQLVPVFDEYKIKGISTLDDLFASRLSKRAAYGRFASPWVTLERGTYTVMFDNSGELSPTRGDAPVHLRLYRWPAP